MRRFGFGSALLLSVVFFPASLAMAGDADPQESTGNFYGNLHGSVGFEDAISGTTAFVPYLNVGGKIAYDQDPGSFGSQFDAEYNYSDASWFNTLATGAVANFGALDTAAHLTYIVDQDRKVGLYTGYSSLGLNAKNPNAPNISLGSQQNLQELDTTAGYMGLGVEAMFALSDQTSMQVRAAILQQVYTSLTTDTGTGPTTSSGYNPFSGPLGFSVAASASHYFTPNISARADANYAQFNLSSTNSNLSLYNAALTGQYNFDSMPLSLGTTAGYGGVAANGSWINDWSLSARATLSFGGPPQGVKGRLFRSGLFSVLN